MYRSALICLFLMCAGCSIDSRHPEQGWTAWAQRRGGLIHDGRATRASHALTRLCANLVQGRLAVHVLDGDVPTAYAWPSGDLFVTRALIDQLPSEDQLIAVLAHEVGHLLDGGQVRTAMMLSGCAPADGDAEKRADDLACQLLEVQGISAESLSRALQTVQSSRHISSGCRRQLRARIARLSPVPLSPAPTKGR